MHRVLEIYGHVHDENSVEHGRTEIGQHHRPHGQRTDDLHPRHRQLSLGLAAGDNPFELGWPDARVVGRMMVARQKPGDAPRQA
jgi:hypothetical protein